MTDGSMKTVTGLLLLSNSELAPHQRSAAPWPICLNSVQFLSPERKNKAVKRNVSTGSNFASIINLLH